MLSLLSNIHGFWIRVWNSPNTEESNEATTSKCYKGANRPQAPKRTPHQVNPGILAEFRVYLDPKSM